MEAVTIIGRDAGFCKLASRILKDRYRTAAFSNIQSALDYIYNDIPDLVVIEIDRGDEKTISFLNLLKEDPIFSCLPVLAVFDGDIDATEWENILFEDYLRKADVKNDILSRVAFGIMRLDRVVEINPLTRLPGNLSIARQIQRRLDKNEIFALAYADLDNFKPFNDRYGFGRGDELIRVTGRIIFSIVKATQPKRCFVGHIGGDDFVIIMKYDLIEGAARIIIEQFDRVIAGFYDPEDWDAGYIPATDRHGNRTNFPITSISIGISDTEKRTFKHHGELMEAASEMKSYAKQFTGSCLKMDQREKNADRK
ncbi:MAG: GGDEF domain-containing protein [Deltaproteobacteria bacterium]|nr:GGDEF domain-containing protein [Deltaproteobacteria bacterium]